MSELIHPRGTRIAEPRKGIGCTRRPIMDGINRILLVSVGWGELANPNADLQSL